MTTDLCAYEVSVKGTDWTRVINARSRGRAKYEYLSDVRESYPDMPYTALRCRKIGRPSSSDEFLRVASYRGLPDVRCGDAVTVGSDTGVIVGHNSSANFDVLFDTGKHAGLVLNVHPSSCVFGDAREIPNG